MTDHLDSETADFLTTFESFFASIASLPIPEQRSTIKETFCTPKRLLERIAVVEERTAPGRNGPIPIRFYSPAGDGPFPVIIYLHRGGWVYGSLDESEDICRKLSNRTGSIVAAVEYRLSPEYKFPVPLEDCYDATKWIAGGHLDIKTQNLSKIIVCGESAGGNLAAAVALMARDKSEFKIAGQLLIYPVLTSHLEKKYYEASPDKSLLSFGNMQFFLDAYLASPDDTKNYYAFPLESKNLAGLPPCFLITAEFDALKHEGMHYGELLQQASVKVQSKCYPKVIHGFIDLPLSDATKEEAIEDIKVWVQGL